MRSYVLIDTAPGTSRAVERACRELDLPGSHVEDVALVFGPYSLILRVEVDDLAALDRLVRGGVQPLLGVRHTTTCIAFDADRST